MYNITPHRLIIYIYFSSAIGRELKGIHYYDDFLENRSRQWIAENIRNRREERKYFESKYNHYPYFGKKDDARKKDIFYFGPYTYDHYIITEFGEILSRDKILRDKINFPDKEWYAYREKLYLENNCVFRKDSVPHTRKSRYHTYYRYPKTTNEKRQYFKVIEDNAESPVYIKIRRSRSAIGLPTAWDDKPRHREKSWKEYRNKQYKEH